MKKEQLVEITPKSAVGKVRASYHGTRWVLRQTTETPYKGATKAKHFGVMSRDGKKFLWILEVNDPDFDLRML